ncbi:MAG TPA: [FeFe] hydrogenase H-cluster radical SAM maturase HydE [Firmicutes bacterium]|nr:[FeFe] hydrogenase H-cluster radical SAM maturase HydE [Candidatus Fermentithermobacillaceae bacterium]
MRGSGLTTGFGQLGKELIEEAQVPVSGASKKGSFGAQSYRDLVDQAFRGISLNESELRRLLNPSTPEEEAYLYLRAQEKRKVTVGPEVHVRGIIEFSNCCRQDCHYCGLRRSNSRLPRYRMSPAEILNAAESALSLHNFGTFVLQSGEDPGYSPGCLAEIVAELKTMGPAVTLSVGQWGYREYLTWKEAGADRFLLKFETSDPVLFKRLKPTTGLYQRLECLRHLRNLGYQVGSGIILGLPGQDEESIVSDILLMKALDLEMASVGPFIPHPDTPLGVRALGGPLDAVRKMRRTLRALAVIRLLLPYAHIPATTALGVISRVAKGWEESAWFEGLRAYGVVEREMDLMGDARGLALLCGANVVMPDVTPRRFRESYEIYPGKTSSDGGELALAVRKVKTMIESVGMTISPGKGDSPKPPWGEIRWKVEGLGSCRGRT